MTYVSGSLHATFIDASCALEAKMATILALTQKVARTSLSHIGAAPPCTNMWGENCRHGDRLGTRGVGSTSEDYNNNTSIID